MARTDLEPIGPINTLGCTNTHNNTLQVLQRTSLGPTSPKAGPDFAYIVTNKYFFRQIIMNVYAFLYTYVSVSCDCLF